MLQKRISVKVIRNTKDRILTDDPASRQLDGPESRDEVVKADSPVVCGSRGSRPMSTSERGKENELTRQEEMIRKEFKRLEALITSWRGTWSRSSRLSKDTVKEGPRNQNLLDRELMPPLP